MKPRAAAPSVDLDALAAALAPRVLPLLVARLTAALAADEPPYSTRAGHEPAEYRGRRKAWLAVARTIPGAVKLGRWWSIPRPAFRAWLEAQASTPAPKPTAAPGEWHPSMSVPAGMRAEH